MARNINRYLGKKQQIIFSRVLIIPRSRLAD